MADERSKQAIPLFQMLSRRSVDVLPSLSVFALHIFAEKYLSRLDFVSRAPSRGLRTFIQEFCVVLEVAFHGVLVSSLSGLSSPFVCADVSLSARPQVHQTCGELLLLNSLPFVESCVTPCGS